jgi:hypothetical protein
VALAGGKGSGDASSIIQGGGEDLTRSAGQVRRADEPARRQTINLQAARAELARREQQQLEGLKRRFEDAILRDEKLAQFKNQIRLEITTEGLQVTVVDEQNRAMFDTGGAALKDYTATSCARSAACSTIWPFRWRVIPTRLSTRSVARLLELGYPLIARTRRGVTRRRHERQQGAASSGSSSLPRC